MVKPPDQRIEKAGQWRWPPATMGCPLFECCGNGHVLSGFPSPAGVLWCSNSAASYSYPKEIHKVATTTEPLCVNAAFKATSAWKLCNYILFTNLSWREKDLLLFKSSSPPVYHTRSMEPSHCPI